MDVRVLAEYLLKVPWIREEGVDPWILGERGTATENGLRKYLHQFVDVTEGCRDRFPQGPGVAGQKAQTAVGLVHHVLDRLRQGTAA